MTETKPEPLLWLTDARGIYIPQAFAQSFGDDLRMKAVANVSDEDWKILEAGPEHEHYWETWEKVERDATVTMPDGIVYTVLESSDVWLIPVGMRWSTATDWFVWPESKEQEDA